MSETRWKRAGSTVPSSDPLKEDTPLSTMERGCRPRQWSVAVAIRPEQGNWVCKQQEHVAGWRKYWMKMV